MPSFPGIYILSSVKRLRMVAWFEGGRNAPPFFEMSLRPVSQFSNITGWERSLKDAEKLVKRSFKKILEHEKFDLHKV